MLCQVALVRTDVSRELSASIIRVTRIGELATDARCKEILSTIKKRWFLQEQHGITSQKMAFFIVTAMKTSNLIKH
jgi:hypothetical protein